MQDVRAALNNTNTSLQQRKTELAPAIAELRGLRAELQDLEAVHAESKAAYEVALGGLESAVAALTVSVQAGHQAQRGHSPHPAPVCPRQRAAGILHTSSTAASTCSRNQRQQPCMALPCHNVAKACMLPCVRLQAEVAALAGDADRAEAQLSKGVRRASELDSALQRIRSIGSEELKRRCVGCCWIQSCTATHCIACIRLWSVPGGCLCKQHRRRHCCCYCKHCQVRCRGNTTFARCHAQLADVEATLRTLRERERTARGAHVHGKEQRAVMDGLSELLEIKAAAAAADAHCDAGMSLADTLRVHGGGGIRPGSAMARTTAVPAADVMVL